MTRTYAHYPGPGIEVVERALDFDTLTATGRTEALSGWPDMYVAEFIYQDEDYSEIIWVGYNPHKTLL